ncbi:MAG: ABC transporter permease subunit [Pyrinomonadaceae bacterium]|nr:ABC transporter permease subunit [Phycisphaerales bacterium]
MPVFLRWFLRLGPINPIAVRLVHGGSRRPRHFYIRTMYLGVLIATLLWSLLAKASGTLPMRDLAAAGASSFTFVAYLQIGLICLIAPVFMAGAIAQEANPKTWDILLTTPLSAAEIVLGNLFGRLFFILALLFASLPLFALTQLFGGVPGTSIFMSYLIAACAALLVGTLAIALSVSRLVGKRAVFAFYVGVVSYLAITFGIDVVTGGSNVTWMTGINPFLALNALLEPTSYQAVPGDLTGIDALFLQTPVKAWCYLSTAISVILMIVSTITVRLGGIAGLGGASGRGGVPWFRRVFGLAAKGAEHRPPKAVWHNPIAWREAAARNATFGKMVARWSFIAFGALFGLGVVLYFHNGTMTPSVFRTVLLSTVLGELGVITLIAVNMSASAVAREREDGTLDLLLTTPLTAGAYLSGKLRGMIAYLLPLLAVPLGTLVLAGAHGMLVAGGVLERPGGVTVAYRQIASGTGAAPIVMEIPAVLPEAALVVSIVTIPFIAFCVMVGMHWSMKSKGSIGSVIATVGILLVVVGVVGACAFKAGQDLPLIGASLSAATPGTAVFSVIEPEFAMENTVGKSGLAAARIGLIIGSIVIAGIWIAIVYGIHANMVRTFDMTVRKLAGSA